MTPPFPNPDRAPTPAELSAWADGELAGPAAGRVEAWLAACPAAAAEVEQARRLTRLYRDHPPADPAPAAWQAALDRIEDRLARPAASPTRPARGWRWGLLLGLVSAASLLAALATRALWPDATPPAGEVAEARPAPARPADDDAFPVASAGEVDILSIDPRDADRIILGDPLLGTFEVAAPEDIELIAHEPGPEDGPAPRLYRAPDAKMPLVIVPPDPEGRDQP